MGLLVKRVKRCWHLECVQCANTESLWYNHLCPLITDKSYWPCDAVSWGSDRKDAEEHLNTRLTPGSIFSTVSHLADGHHWATEKFLCAQSRNGAPSHGEWGIWWIAGSTVSPPDALRKIKLIQMLLRKNYSSLRGLYWEKNIPGFSIIAQTH